MITVNVIGSYEGNEESKSYPGLVNIYFKTILLPPPGLLHVVKCPREYGAAEEGMQKIGNFAILAEPERVPVIAIGEKITASATLWPVLKPYWNRRDSNIAYYRNFTPVYLLDGEIKPTNAKAVPASFAIKCYYGGALRDESGEINVHCQLEDMPPSFVLRNENIKKSKSFTSAQQKLGQITLKAAREHVPAIPANAPIEAKGIIWPVISPYWNENSETVVIQKIPTPVFLVNHAISTEKVKAPA